MNQCCPAVIVVASTALVLSNRTPTDGLKANENACQVKSMDSVGIWEGIATAPYDCDLELAVIEGDRVHSLIFACRRTARGWLKASTRERVSVDPTHWRRWSPER